MVHVGQTETIAGKGAGKQFKTLGAKKVLIVIHEASNSGLTQRADGVKRILGSSKVKVLTIPNAKSDIPGTKTKVKAAFTADRSLDALLGLDPDVTIPCTDVVPSGTKVGTFDVGGSIKLIQSGKMKFAIDQQQYLQGYLPVVFAMLYGTNLNTIGNGAPVLTGPGSSTRRTPPAWPRSPRRERARRTLTGGRPSGRPPAASVRWQRPQHRPRPRRAARPRRPADADPHAARHRRLSGRGRDLLRVRRTSPAASTGSPTRDRRRVDRPGGAVRDRRRPGRAADDRRRVRPLGRRDDRQLGAAARLPRRRSRT